MDPRRRCCRADGPATDRLRLSPMTHDDAKKRTERLQLMLDDEELKAIDEWRFENRMPSRAAAIRELLRRGLKAPGFDEPEPGTKSAEFSVVDEP